jgi:hypothetical protein
VQIKDLLLTISDVVDQEKGNEGKLEERKPHVENLQKYAYELFEETLLPLIDTSRRSGCLKISRPPFASVFLLNLSPPKNPAAFSPP